MARRKAGSEKCLSQSRPLSTRGRMGGRRSIIAILCAMTVAAGIAAGFPRYSGENQAVAPPNATDNVAWWLDPERGALCWIGKRLDYRGLEFFVDLDGVRSTGMTSDFNWLGGVGNYTQHMTWYGSGGGGLL